MLRNYERSRRAIEEARRLIRTSEARIARTSSLLLTRAREAPSRPCALAERSIGRDAGSSPDVRVLERTG